MSGSFTENSSRVPDILILNYHRVGTPSPQARYRGMFVTPTHLRQQIRILKKAGFVILPVCEALHAPYPRIACLSFDDGYVDNLSSGLPVLASEGVRGSLYIVTGDVGKRQHIWKEAGEKLPADLLDWDQIAALKEAGWEIGSHGHSHIHLADKPPQQQLECIETSQENLKKHLGQMARTFAYPYGSHSPETSRLIAGAGFEAALTTLPGLNHQGQDLFQLRRIALKGYRFHHYLKTRLDLRSYIH